MNEDLKSRALEVKERLIDCSGYLEAPGIIQELLDALEAQERATEIAVKARREAVDALRRRTHEPSSW